MAAVTTLSVDGQHGIDVVDASRVLEPTTSLTSAVRIKTCRMLIEIDLETIRILPF